MSLPGDGDPDTDFFRAVAVGDVDRAAHFLRNGQKAQSKSPSHFSAILRAVMNCHQDSQLRMVQLLIDFGANVNERHMETTPLHSAAKSGANAVARLLLENEADPDIASGFFETTPLHVATASGASTVTKLLFEYGADPDVASSAFGTPLVLAACSGLSTATRLLLENGADPNRTTAGGSRPLQVAACNNKAEVAHLLLRGGATVSSQCLCNRLGARGGHSIVSFRENLHVWAKDTVQSNTGFKCVFLPGCSRTGTSLGSLKDNSDVLRLIGRFLDIQSHLVINRLRQAVSSMESIEWENHDERETHRRWRRQHRRQHREQDSESNEEWMWESEDVSEGDDTDRSWA